MAKRVALRRRSPLRADPVKAREWHDRSRQEIPRKAKLSSVTKNAAKRDRDFERAYHSEEYVVAVKKLECYVPGCYRRPVDAAHGEHSKASVGTWRAILPLCSGPDGHHREQHDLGRRTFEAKYGISLDGGARATRRLLAHITGESFTGDRALDLSEPVVSEQEPTPDGVIVEPCAQDFTDSRADVLHSSNLR